MISQPEQRVAESRVTRGSVLRAVSSSYGQGLISTAVGLLMTPLYLAYLGTDHFGLWATVLSIAGYFSMGGFGLPQASSNLMAGAAARGARDEFARVFSASVRLATTIAAIGCGVLAVIVIGGRMGLRLFDWQASSAAYGLTLLAIVTGGLLINLPLEQARAAVRAWQRVHVDQAILSVVRLSSLIFTLAVFWTGGGLLAVAFLHAATLVLPGAAAWVIGKKSLGLPLTLPAVDRRSLGVLVSPGAHFFILMVAGALIWGTDNVVIAAYSGTAAVTPYAVVTRLFAVAVGWMSLGLGALTPTVAALWGANDLARLRSMFVTVLRMSLAFALLLSIELGVFGRGFVILWTGGRTSVDAGLFAVVWAVYCVRMVGMSFEPMLIGTSQHHTYAYLALAEGFINLAISLLLVRVLGSVGVALGTLVALLVGTGWYVPWRSMRLAGLTWATLRREILLPMSLPCVVSGGAAIATHAVFGALAWTTWLLSTSVTAAAFVLVYSLFVLTEREKELIREVLRRRSAPR